MSARRAASGPDPAPSPATSGEASPDVPPEMSPDASPASLPAPSAPAAVRMPSALRLLATAARYGVRAPAYRRLHARYRVRRLDRLLTLSSCQVVAVGEDVWRADAFRALGARCLAVEPAGAPHPRPMDGEPPDPGECVVADGYWLPVRDGAADLAYCDAAFASAPDAVGVLDELARITRVGGLVCLSLTGARRSVARHLLRRTDLTLLTRLARVPLPRRRAELVLRRTA